jgi:hypothetical protein
MVHILNRHSQLNMRAIEERLAKSHEIGQQQRWTGGREETLPFSIKNVTALTEK